MLSVFPEYQHYQDETWALKSLQLSLDGVDQKERQLRICQPPDKSKRRRDPNRRTHDLWIR
jgi:hypothetical protein